MNADYFKELAEDGRREQDILENHRQQSRWKPVCLNCRSDQVQSTLSWNVITQSFEMTVESTWLCMYCEHPETDVEWINVSNTVL